MASESASSAPVKPLPDMKHEGLTIAALLMAIAVLLFFWHDNSGTPMAQNVENVRLAIQQGQDAAVQSYLRQGQDPNMLSSTGHTLLQDAIANRRTEIVRLLLGYGADANFQAGAAGDPPLVAAVKANREEIVRLLLTRSADVNRQDADGDTALMAAVRLQYDSLVDMLLGTAANLQARDPEGNTALLIAATQGWLDGVGKLLAHGAVADVANNKGESPLTVAVRQRNIAMAEKLLKTGATMRGEMAIAIAQYDKPMIRLLLNTGARVSPQERAALVDAATKLDDTSFLRQLSRYGIR